MSTYTIENAKSARSSCKKCKEKIEKGGERIGVHSDLGDGKIMTKWYKVGCFPIPRKFALLPIEEFLDEHLIDETEDKVLDDPTKRQQLIDVLSTKKEKKKTNTKAAATAAASAKKGSAFIESIKRNVETLDNIENDEPAKKKIKLSDTDKAIAEVYLKYNGMKTGELKDILSWNNVVKTGTKEVLLTRVIDGCINGRIANCVACGEGKPRISDDGSIIECNGYYDSDIGSRIVCSNKIKVESAERYKPWYDHEPTTKEEEAMKKEGVNETNNKLPDEMIQAVKKMEWKLTNKENIKKATKEIVQLCSSKVSTIDFPSSTDVEIQTRMEVGKLILQNKNESAVSILDLIVNKYGLKERNDENAKRNTKLVENMCTRKANAGVYEAIKELSSLYFKEKNTNAGITYRKVSEAVKNLDFKITEKNAKGLGKGKTKIAGIGKASGDKIHEFVTTGKIAKLEEKRAAQA
jgi:hypothetical protein